MEILPLFSTMKVYKKDVMYNQGDQSLDIFFIIRGRVKFYVDLNQDVLGKEPANVPIHLHVEGSYFGDSDVLINRGKDGRESTAVAETECDLEVINRQNMMKVLRKFPEIKNEMKEVAKRRRANHWKNVKFVRGTRGLKREKKADPLANEYKRSNS